MSFLYEYIIKHLFYAKLKEVGHKHRTNHCCECCFVDVGVVLHCFDCRFDDLFYLELFAKVDFTKNFVECHFDVNSRLFLKCCTRFMKWFIMIWYWTYLLIQTKPFFCWCKIFFYNEIEIQFEVCLHVIVVTADSCFFSFLHYLQKFNNEFRTVLPAPSSESCVRLKSFVTQDFFSSFWKWFILPICQLVLQSISFIESLNNFCKYIMKMLLRRKHSKIITHHLKVVCRRVWQMANIVVISFPNGKTLTCGFFMHQKVRKWLWCLMVACFEVYRKR